MSNISTTKSLGKVAVLLGGESSEREVSLISGKNVLQALARKGVAAEAVDTGDSDFITRLQQDNYARAFIALHGKGGEDGSIQALLETLKIPYTGSGIAASALNMSKYLSKLAMESCSLNHAANYKTTPFSLVKSVEELKLKSQEINKPLVVKPSQAGSSIGISFLDKQPTDEAVQESFNKAREVDKDVIAELWVDGAEYAAAIVDNQPQPLVRINTNKKLYDYDAKYKDGGTEYLCPCGLSSQYESALQQIALDVFLMLGCSGWGRVDLILEGDVENSKSMDELTVWVLEINTVPGLTERSLVPQAAKAAGVEFDDLIINILEETK